MRLKNDLLSSGTVPDLALHNGETLIWADRPRPGIQFGRADFFLIPAGLILFLLPLVAICIVAGANLHPAIYFILSPFFMLSLLPPVGHILFDAWRRKKTIYAITDQRVVIQTTLSKKNVTSYNLRKIDHPELEINKDKSGSIRFGKEDPRSYNFKGTRVNTKTEKMDSIEDAAAVYKTLMDLRK